MATVAYPTAQAQEEYDDAYDDEGNYEGGMDDDDDDDFDEEMDAQAEALAQQMSDQLRAELGKAYGPQGQHPSAPLDPSATILSTIQSILKHANDDSQLLAILSNTPLSPSPDAPNVYAILLESQSAGRVDPLHAEALSCALLSLADGETLDALQQRNPWNV